MPMRRKLYTAVFIALIPAIGLTEDYSDPTWPCVQRKVENLSLGIMWPHLVPETPEPATLSASAQRFADTVVLRRVSLDQVDEITATFAQEQPDLTTDEYTLIFQEIFENINRDRQRLIAGIGRYSLSQIDLAARIDAARVEMDGEMAKDDPDFDRVDELEEQLDWDQRIYRDRAQSLLYVCETPVILEKRVYAIAQTLAQHVPD